MTPWQWIIILSGGALSILLPAFALWLQDRRDQTARDFMQLGHSRPANRNHKPKALRK